jgi:hypothetical protein
MNRRCFDLFNKVSYSGYKKEEIADLFKSSKVVHQAIRMYSATKR